MRALVLDAPRTAQVRHVPTPHLAPGEVLVSIERVGICGSDLAVFRGTRPATYPLILGHEAVGRVLDPGDSEHAPGSRVVIEPNVPCGRCNVCRRGRGNVCPSKRSLGMNWPGTFAERVAIASEFAHPLPGDIDMDDAIGIEPLAVALHAVEAGQVHAGDRVAVIGCGAEGLLLVQVLVACGAEVVAADLQEERLQMAQRLGAQNVVRVTAEPAASLDAQLCAPIVFEAAGAAPAFELALRAAAPGGRVVALGLASSAVQLVPLAFVRRGLTLVGSLIYDHPTDFQLAIDLVRQHKIRPAQLIVDVVNGLDALPPTLEALSITDRGGKTLVTLDVPT